MIERYAVIAGRIRLELEDIERVVSRSERAVRAARQSSENQDLFLDSAALNLHDYYAGLERIFSHIATSIDRDIPAGYEWHRELLRQMAIEVPNVRPKVLSAESVRSVDEFLRFRHVVRNIYTFEFDLARLDSLVKHLQPCFELVKADLLAFATYLDQLAQA